MGSIKAKVKLSRSDLAQARLFKSVGVGGYLLHKSTGLTPIKSYKRAAEKKVSLNTHRKLSAFNHKTLLTLAAASRWPYL